MFALSKTTGYAIRALTCLNTPPSQSRQIREVARASGVPRPYLAKIVNVLVQQQILTTRRGTRGGIALARPAAEISLCQLVEALEGPLWIGACLLSKEKCVHHSPCPINKWWQPLRRQTIAELNRITLGDFMPAPPTAMP